MTLQLDQRQRAMLLEMGIRVWLAEPPSPGKTLRPTTSATSAIDPAKSVTEKSAVTTAAPPKTTHLPQPARNIASSARSTHSLTIAPPAPVYAQADGPAPEQNTPVWLLFCEAPATGTVSTFMQTAAGRLLDNMLHALHLRNSPHVHLCLLSRQTGSAANVPASPPADALNAAIDQLRPSVILLMGRQPAQLLLQRHEPLGQLRSHIHSIRQTPVVVTYDPSGLLRAPADKARAWADLCLALQASIPPPSAG